ncbi:hypothetical protein DV515_00012306 [Chloebia gouldiae]|uniref:Nudix hydrolase domain-containing protein n=1 Tax=Chloebia gouldiae TaxID=44316 RepID=A0A3L8S582_CHLGU|nr:hypothetical protein DV515_00012306 [Chloebia gouldiae]
MDRLLAAGGCCARPGFYILPAVPCAGCQLARPWLAQVLLVSSSRHPDRWIVPGGGMEPEEEPGVAAVREVCEEVERETGSLVISPSHVGGKRSPKQENMGINSAAFQLLYKPKRV